MKVPSLKLAAVSLLPIFFSQQAFADHLTCSLDSQGEYKIVTLNLADASASEAGVQSDSVYDLNFYLTAQCEPKSCVADILISSAQLEDEAGSLQFEFERTPKDKRVLEEPLTDAPDGRPYQLSCQYASDT